MTTLAVWLHGGFTPIILSPLTCGPLSLANVFDWPTMHQGQPCSQIQCSQQLGVKEGLARSCPLSFQTVCFCAVTQTSYPQEQICLKDIKSQVCGSKSLVLLCPQIWWFWRWDGAWDRRSFWEFLFRIREETTTMTWEWESVRLNRHIWKAVKQRN